MRILIKAQDIVNDCCWSRMLISFNNSCKRDLSSYYSLHIFYQLLLYSHYLSGTTL